MSKYEELILKNIESEKFFETIEEAYRHNGEDREALEAALLQLHNSEKINIIEKFSEFSSNSNHCDIFTFRRIFGNILPKLEGSVSSVIQCIKHLILEVGDQPQALNLISSFQKFCETDSERAERAYSCAISDNVSEINFLTPAIVAGAIHDTELYLLRAIELVEHANFNIQINAIRAIGLISYADCLPLILDSLKSLRQLIEDTKNDHSLATALHSAINIYLNNTDTESEIEDLVKMVVSNDGDLILNTASAILSLEADKLPDSLIELFLGALRNTNPSEIGTIDNLDFGLTDLYKKNKKKQVMEFVEYFINKNEGNFSIKKFDSLMHEIIENDLDYVVTKWFLSKKVCLCRSVTELMPETSSKESHVKADLSQLTKTFDGEIIFLARKACGWLFFRPVNAASFILTLIDELDTQELQEISDMLFDPLLLSYSGKVKDFLESEIKASKGKTKKCIKEALLRLENYHRDLSSVSELSELYPTQSQRETYSRYHSRLMNQALKDTPRAFLSDLFHVSVLLYGNSSISYIHHGASDEKSRQEFELQQHSHSIEFPSLEYLNPHGLDNTLRLFRIEGCIV